MNLQKQLKQLESGTSLKVKLTDYPLATIRTYVSTIKKATGTPLHIESITDTHVVVVARSKETYTTFIEGIPVGDKEHIEDQSAIYIRSLAKGLESRGRGKYTVKTVVEVTRDE